ncbi:hypothetical protein LV779_16325 [Streptomyces thinghirensis]|nr:hypothetical protein [Streptomyces thinghirensis]
MDEGGEGREVPACSPDPKKVAQIKPKSALSAELAGVEFTWDNFTVRYTSEGRSEYGLAPIPHHGRQAHRPVPRLADARAYKRTEHSQGSRPARLHGSRPRGRQDHGLRPGRTGRRRAQYDAQPTDPVNKAIAAYEESLVEAGVLEEITPHPERCRHL